MEQASFSTVSALKDLLNHHGISPKKAFDQNFLIDERVVSQITEAAHLEPGDRLVEVGAGVGILTALLLQTGADVTAVESDRDMTAILEERFGAQPNFHLVPEDVRRFNFAAVTQPFSVVSNLPYSITGQVLRILTETPHPPKRIVVMVQREVAEKMIAQPGKMTALSVAIQLFGTPQIVTNVPRSAFWPAPGVDSTVVAIKTHAKPIVSEPNELMRLVRIGFSNRRQLLKNNLRAGLHMSTNEAAALIKKAGFKPTARAQELSLDQWVVLEKCLDNRHGADSVHHDRN